MSVSKSLLTALAALTAVVAASFTGIALSLVVARPSRCDSRHQFSRVLPIIIMLMCSLLPGPAPAQFAQKGPKLVGTNPLEPSASDQGYSVSLSGDGNSAIVGERYAYTYLDQEAGAAWVFTRSGGAWSQPQEINLPNTVPPALVFSVSLSADGNTAILGTPVNLYFGYAQVYVRSAGAWIPQAVLANGELYTNTGLLEGYSVSLSADGNTAIIGAPGVAIYNGPLNPAPDTGAALVFTRSTDGGSTQWTQQAELVGIDIIGNSAGQGYSVSLSGDGNTAIVGGPLDNGGAGAAWVFTRSIDGGWSQQAKLVGGGSSVSLSNDGNTAIVGNASRAVVYARSSTASGIAWNQGATLAGTGATVVLFGSPASGGFSVSLSADGNSAMVGTSVFARTEVGWTQQELPLGAGAVGDAAQGFSAALSADSHTSIVGGPDDNHDAGAAWVYSEFVFRGTPGQANCHSQRVSALAWQYGGLNSAAAALGFSDVSALQHAIMAFCRE